MNWNTFILNLGIIYLIYYGMNLLFDYIKGRKSSPNDDTDNILFFEEHSPPEIIAYGDNDKIETPDPVPAHQENTIDSKMITSTGAVSLKQLFHLAKDNLIEHTAAIPY